MAYNDNQPRINSISFLYSDDYICSSKLMESHFKTDQHCMINKVLQNRSLFTISISHEFNILGTLYVYTGSSSNGIPWRFPYHGLIFTKEAPNQTIFQLVQSCAA